MKLTGLTITNRLAATGFLLLVTAHPSLAQTDLNVQLQQALCAQNWEGAIDVLEKMKSAAGREYASQITMYQGQIYSLARSNISPSAWQEACSAPNPSAPAPRTNSIPPAPSPGIPPAPRSNPSPQPSNDILTLPSNNTLPPPPP